MRKLSKLMLTLLMIAGVFGTANAQLIDEKDVTVTMDLQPVLQLDMTTANQLEFVFDDINEYYAGITNYAATILKVSSTVSWDLYAVGRSSGSTADGFCEVLNSPALTLTSTSVSCIVLVLRYPIV